MDSETAFLSGLIELQYGQKVEHQLRKIAAQVSWARGWPENDRAFWNAEAFMWQRKIEKEVRQLIMQEVKPLRSGKNLDLGCGSYSYIPSVGVDLSEKMLQLNENCIQKVQGDVEKPLSFSTGSFDSVTAIFLLNYIHHYQSLLGGINRVLKEKGCFVAVLSATKISDWQRQKEVNQFSVKRWMTLLQRAGLRVKIKEKSGLVFFYGQK